MFLTDAPGNVANKYVEEDESILRPPTQLTAEALNCFQEELANIVLLSGGELDKEDNTQVYQHIRQMIANAANGIVLYGVAFDASVADGAVVRWDAANDRFDEAVADGTANNRAIGVADKTNSRLYVFGLCPVFSGLTPGQRYYLSATTPGVLVTSAPADGVSIGVAKDETTIILDIDGMGVRLNQANNWTAGQYASPKPFPVTTGNLTLDLTAGNNWEGSATGPIVLMNPSAMPLNLRGTLTVYSGAGGNDIVGFGSYWKGTDGIKPISSSAVNAKHVYPFMVLSATEIWIGKQGAIS